MKPSTEKMTKPPNTLVAQLISDTITESLFVKRTRTHDHTDRFFSMSSP